MDETKMKEKENTVNEEITQENKETFSDGWGKIQRNAYQLTINNPAEHGLDHRTIKEILIKNFTTIEFFCMADEIGEQGTYHTLLLFLPGTAKESEKTFSHRTYRDCTWNCEKQCGIHQKEWTVGRYNKSRNQRPEHLRGMGKDAQKQR